MIRAPSPAPVRGIIDPLDTSGRIVDVDPRRAPTGVGAEYCMQAARYRLIAPAATA